jgi:hypothetical protein
MLGAALLVIALAGVLYWLYVRRQREYYTARDARVLRTMTLSLDDLIAANSVYVKNWVRYGDESVIPVTENCGETVDETANAKLPAMLQALPGKELFTRQLRSSGKELVLRFGYYALAGPQLPRLGAVVRAPASPPPEKAAGKPPALTLRRGCSDVALADLLQPAFNIDLARAFDMILVASSDGHVLYRVQPPQSRSTLLFANAAAKNDAGASPVQIEELGALTESTGWRGAPKALEIKALGRVTRTKDVILADESYILFSQPYALSVTAKSAPEQQQWVVCGLVSSRRFKADIFAIPAPIVMLATALAVLAICAWPFLRIGLMNELEPLTISDAVLVAICTIIAAAILTIAILDTFAYMHLTNIARSQLSDFGKKLADDYANDVDRAVVALDAIREKTKDAVDWSGASILDRISSSDEVKNYPYIRSLAWVGRDGVERYKYSAEAKSPRVEVSARQYFNDVLLDNELWLSRTKRKDGSRIPFAIQWVRSAATGRVTAVIAEPTQAVANPVIVLGTELIDLSSAVAPPDVRFAIIDEQGNVVYHSEQQRIGYENLFAETDQSPKLRSVVIGRRAGFVETSYWGDNTEMYVRPLANSPWTLVVFRAKRLVRVLNEEAVLLTLLPLLLTSMPYLLLYIVILIAAPRYRAPSLWPDWKRRGDYVRLARLYLFLGAAYGAAIYVFAPASLPPIVFLFPAQTIVSTYVLLHRDDRRPRTGFAIAVWLASTVLLACVIKEAALDPGVLPVSLAGARTWIPKAGVFALLLVSTVASLSFFMPASEGGAARTSYRMGYGTAYRLCGALLLAVAAALPVVGFFKIASHIDVELYVKGAQLRLATLLEARLNQLASLNALDDAAATLKRDAVDYQTTHVFGTQWCIAPPPKNGVACEVCECPPRSVCTCPPRSTIPPLFPDVLPNLSDDFVAMRQLQEPASEDRLWSWSSGEKGALRLERLIRLKPLNVTKLYDGPPRPERQSLILTSAVPLIRDTHPQGIAHLAWLVTLSLLVFGVFWMAADFIARRLLLIDLAEPLWLAQAPLSPTLGDHIFLVRRNQSADELTGTGSGMRFYDVSLEELEKRKSSTSTLASIDRSAAGRNVRITDFEYGIDDGEKNREKLEWLERLMALPNRTVVVVSAVSRGYVYTAPLTAPAAPAPPAPDPAAPAPPPAPAPEPATSLRARWELLLASFVWVTQEQLELPKTPAEQTAAASLDAPRANQPPGQGRLVDRVVAWLEAVWRWLKSRLAFKRDPRDWIDLETEHDPVLARLAKEMVPLRARVPKGEERERFRDEIGERARTYFAGLWASCSVDERVLLHHLARHGLLNGKDRRLVRRLLARRFIRRGPQIELFSETFRLYVLSVARREQDLKTAESQRPSRWKNLRGALAILVLAFVLMLFATQKDLLSTAQGLVTSLTASVPLIIKLLGLLGDRRTDAAARG